MGFWKCEICGKKYNGLKEMEQSPFLICIYCGYLAKRQRLEETKVSVLRIIRRQDNIARNLVIASVLLTATALIFILIELKRMGII